MRRILLLAWILAALTGCTLSFGGAEEELLAEFSGEPLVRITAPLDNATYLTDVTVNVQIQVANAGTDIDRVEVFLDDALIGTLPKPNPASASAFGVTQTFTPVGAGARVVKVIAYRADGTASQPASVTVQVVDQLPQSATPTGEPTATATVAPPPTSTTAPATAVTLPSATPQTVASAAPPAASTVQQPPPASGTAIAKFEGVVNVRSGPHVNFEPPLGTFQAGQQTEILGLNNDDMWLKVRFGAGTGWVFAELVKVEGSLAALPREAGPPIPTARPVVNTPVPPTNAPANPTQDTATDGPNLVVVGWQMATIDAGRPYNDIVSGRPSIAFVRVRNAGNRPTPDGFFAVLTISNTSDGGDQRIEAGAVGVLEPGQEYEVQIGFTDTAGPGTARTAIVRLDGDNRIAETNENDNASTTINYTLAAP